MIPILMALFAAGGISYGMAEESLAFYALVCAVMIAAGFDALTGAAVVLLGAGIGTLGSTINPFATVIASNAAGVPFTDGIRLRVVILVVGWLICVAYVMLYAQRVKADPSVARRGPARQPPRILPERQEPRRAARSPGAPAVHPDPVRGQLRADDLRVSVLGWYMAEMSAMFLAFEILVGVIWRMGEPEFTETFVNGSRDLLGVALVIGIARGIAAVMDDGKITDTILHPAEGAVSGLSQIAFINVMYGIEVALSFLVPSSSGLAVLTMPIMAPPAHFSDVQRDAVVTAYQSASGIAQPVQPDLRGRHGRPRHRAGTL